MRQHLVEIHPIKTEADYRRALAEAERLWDADPGRCPRAAVRNEIGRLSSMNHTPLFHPAVAAWFARSFAAPTEAQRAAWPAIKEESHVLIAAPTGSGKTLAAFLAAIDGLVRQ